MLDSVCSTFFLHSRYFDVDFDEEILDLRLIFYHIRNLHKNVPASHLYQFFAKPIILKNAKFEPKKNLMKKGCRDLILVSKDSASSKPQNHLSDF